MIIIVIGLAASGKNYVSEVIAEHFDFHHQDADLWLLPEMKQAILKGENFTFAMLDDFTQAIIENIQLLKEKHTKLVISQALYRDKNRQKIIRNFPDDNLLFIQVDSDDEIILERLKKRGDWISPEYAELMHKYFQPMHSAKKINNNIQGPTEIISQLHNLKL